MIQIRLRQIAEAKNINKSQLSLRAQVGIGVIRRYWNDDSTSVDLRVIDSLCEILDCEPGDLIKRVKP